MKPSLFCFHMIAHTTWQDLRFPVHHRLKIVPVTSTSLITRIQDLLPSFKFKLICENSSYRAVARTELPFAGPSIVSVHSLS